MKMRWPYLLVFLVAGCATSPTGRNQLLLVSPQAAINASAEAYVETLKPLEADGKVDPDPRQSARIRHITGRVVAQAVSLYPQTRGWAWSVKVLDDPDTVNAWCMAGGRMAIYTGLIDKLEATDDEIGQVMAHEVAHALANHSAEKMSVAMASSVGVAAIGIAADDSKYRTVALTGAALAATYAIKMPNSRTAESEADQIGLELAARAGFDPRASISLWRKMARVNGSKGPEFLSTHPLPSTRIRDLERRIPAAQSLYQPNVDHPVYDFR